MLKPTLTSAQADVDKKVKEKKEEMRRNELKAKDDRKALLENARKRPMLIDSWNTGTYRANNLAKAQTLKKYIQVMKDAGMSEKEIEKHHLSLDDKEALEEDKFVNMQMKRSGKTKDDQ